MEQDNYFICAVRHYVRKCYEIMIVLVSYMINLALYRKKIQDPSKIKKVLIIKLDHIGDVVLATPSITNIKTHFKNAEIDILVNPLCKDLVSTNPYIDNVIGYDSLFFKRGEGYNLFRNASIIFRLFKERYDVIIDLRGSFGTLILALFKGAEFRADFGTNSIKNRKVLLKKHKLERNLEIIRGLGVKTISKTLSINLTKKDGAFADRFFRKNDIKKKDLTIVINPGAAWTPRMWPKENYALLIDRLVKELGAKIILAGSNDEISLAEWIKEKIDSDIYIATGKTSLRELSALIKGSSMYIGNDSAAIHLAAAVGTPLIALFGPENPEKFGPMANKKIILQKKVGCSPCGQYYCSRKPNCMELIKVDEVFDSVKLALKKWKN